MVLPSSVMFIVLRVCGGTGLLWRPGQLVSLSVGLLRHRGSPSVFDGARWVRSGRGGDQEAWEEQGEGE